NLWLPLRVLRALRGSSLLASPAGRCRSPATGCRHLSSALLTAPDAAVQFGYREVIRTRAAVLAGRWTMKTSLAEPARSAPIRLSTRCTYYWIVAAPVGIAAFLVLAALAFAGVLPGNGADSPVLPWLFVAAAIAAALGWWVFLLRLKDAWLDGDSLCVSDIHETERIPLAQIREVRTYKWLNPKLAKVLLDGDSRFGKSILFALPLQFWPLPWEDHTLAEGLREEV